MKMNTRIIVRFVSLVAAGLFIASSPSAQTPAGLYSVKGSVADSTTTKALELITVNLLSAGNTANKVTVTKADGSFSFAGLPAGKYSIEIIALGYKRKATGVDLLDSTHASIDLGQIYVSSQVTGLKEVVVTANRPVVRREVDRLIYDLQADPDSKAYTVLEMMRKVPYLSLDAEDNIQLKGSSNYKILINGKPSSLMENNPKEVLRSMPASTIQRIEVITTPPSKYDAEGLAGIINIITNKKISNGYNGSINVSERFPVGGPGFGESFAIKQGKLGITGYGGGGLTRSPYTSYSADRVGSGTNATELLQYGKKKSHGRNGYFGTELSYEIDSLNLVAVQLNLNGYKSDNTDQQSTSLSDQGGTVMKYDLENESTNKGNGFDASFNYQLGFKKDKSKLLTFSARYFEYTGRQSSDVSLFQKVNYAVPDFRQFNEGNAVEKTFQLDYVQQVKKVGVEAGVKAIFRNNKSDFQYLSFNSSAGEFEKDPSRSNNFFNEQNIFGAYNTYQYSSKNWDYKGGVRIEQTITNVDFISNNTKVKQNYFNVIPSVVINRRFKDRSSLNLGFSQRIKRPGINRLNPFVDRSNPNFETSGNPNLRRVLLNNIQLGYNIPKKLSVNISTDYSFGKKLDLRITTFDPATNITRTTYENTGKASRWGFDLNINYPITKNWNIGLNTNVAYFTIDGFVNNALVKLRTYTYNSSASTGYRFNSGWRLGANLTVISKNPGDLQITTNGLVSSSFNVNKDIVKDRLSFSAFANNPFTKYRFNRTKITGPDFFERSYTREYFRVVGFSLNYRFGKLKDQINKNRRSIRNDDVSN